MYAGGGTLLLAVCVFSLLTICIYNIRYDKLKSVDGLNDKQIYAAAVSPNGRHIIQSVVTHQGGVELYKDGERFTNNLYGLEYSPIIGDNGDVAYLMVDKSYASSKLLYNNDKIFEKNTLCGNLRLLKSHILGDMLIFSSFDKKKEVVTLYKYRRILFTGKLEPICSFEKSVIEDIRVLPDNHIAALVEDYSDGRRWKLFDIDISKNEVHLQLEGKERLFFTNDDKSELVVDKVDLESSVNSAYLFNSWYYLYRYHIREPFSYGNDFAGMLSWIESYRVDGLLNLYKKTNDDELTEKLRLIAGNILNARNKNIGMPQDKYNQDFLWSSRKYSLHDEPLCLMVNQCVIMDALLRVANSGILKEDMELEIRDNAERMFQYYEEYYDGRGHYHFPKGSPFWADGVQLPWNQQNVMTNVCLELWIASGDDKYLQRAKALMMAFLSEVKNHESKVYWNYWPDGFYKGWNKDENISVNTPEYKASSIDDRAEDISHAAINADTMVRFSEVFNPNDSSWKNKIEENMNEWCKDNGFTATISGEKEASMLNVPSGKWAKFYNPKLSHYVCLGPQNVGVDYNLMSYCAISSEYYQRGKSYSPLRLEKYAYRGDGKWCLKNKIELSESQIKDYVKSSYSNCDIE